MYLGGYCPGCGGGEGNQSCAIARCSLEQNVEFCCHCPAYPCARYEGLDAYDSFVSTRNRRENLEKIRTLGPETCRTELMEKAHLLDRLLTHYNAGRQKSLFAIAADLLDLEDLRSVMEQLEAETVDAPVKDRAAAAMHLLQETAARRGLELKLRKKPKTR